MTMICIYGRTLNTCFVGCGQCSVCKIADYVAYLVKEKERRYNGTPVNMNEKLTNLRAEVQNLDISVNALSCK